VGQNHVRLLRDGVEAFPAMLAAIDAARDQILLEMYWFDSDVTGSRFVAALGAAARRGVEVAVLYDSVGSWDVDEEQFERLRAHGARVVEFNPLAPYKRRFRLARLTRRDHRKVLVVDGRVGFTGGINLADAWAPSSEGGGGWRDDTVCVEGSAVVAFVDAFGRTWRAQGGTPLVRGSTVPCPPLGTQDVRVLGEGAKRRQIVRAYLHNIYGARQRIWIANSYFVPDRAVLRALRHAGRRGLDVRVIVPGHSDVAIVRHASRAVWKRLMDSGVRIYEWQGSMIHSKTAVIDGVWSTIGTFNLDYQSLRMNLEINVAVNDPAFGAVVEASFESDLLQSREVDPEQFRYRSLSDRLAELLCYRLRKFL
jgi:cardiolipin synthase